MMVQGQKSSCILKWLHSQIIDNKFKSLPKERGIEMEER
jgi:hypothetical protein